MAKAPILSLRPWPNKTSPESPPDTRTYKRVYSEKRRADHRGDQREIGRMQRRGLCHDRQ